MGLLTTFSVSVVHSNVLTKLWKCLLILVSTSSNKETQYIAFVLDSFEKQGRLK